MKYELIHDTIAQQVFQKASTEARTRRKVEKYIRERYEAHQLRGVKLTEDDLDYITPYLAMVNISKEEEAFIEDGKKALIASRRRRWVLVAGIMATLTAFLGIAIWQGVIAQKAHAKFQFASETFLKSVLDAAKQDIVKLRYEESHKKYSDAYKLEKLPEKVAKGMMELALYYGEFDRLLGLGLADTAAMIMPSNDAKQELQAARKAGSDYNSHLQKALKHMDPAWYDTLSRRYFPHMVFVKGGQFQMGDENGESKEKPIHPVKLSDYHIGATEVTIWQYNLYCKATGEDSMQRIKPNLSWGLNGDIPVVNVSWFDAARYANWMSRRAGLDTIYIFSGPNDLESIRYTAKGYRLPTEAEWEYAAAGGPKGYDEAGKRKYVYAGTSVDTLLGDYAWYGHNSGNRTQPVAKKHPNDLGLYDMSGNVREWCQDWYEKVYPDTFQVNPTGPKDGRDSSRVIRGGDGFYGAYETRVGHRDDDYPDSRYLNYSFRLLRTP